MDMPELKITIFAYMQLIVITIVILQTLKEIAYNAIQAIIY